MTDTDVSTDAEVSKLDLICITFIFKKNRGSFAYFLNKIQEKKWQLICITDILPTSTW